MIRKRVWLGLILVLVIILFSNRTLGAINYGFMISENKCGSEIDGTLVEDAQFKSEFFATYSDAGFSVLSQPTMKREGGKGCMGDVIEDGEKLGVFGYGYLYTIDQLNSNQFRVGAYSSQNEEWHSQVRFNFYDIASYKSGSFESFIKNSEPKATCSETAEAADDSHSGDLYSYATGNCQLTLEPGAYFVSAGIVGWLSGRIGGWTSVTLGQELALARFNNEETAYSHNTNHVSSNPDVRISSDAPRYVITTNKLSNVELNSIFKGYVENTSALCHAAGGQMITELAGTPYSTLASIPSDFDKNHICCGDDANTAYIYYADIPETYDEIYSYTYKPTPTTTETLYCRNRVWTKNNNAGSCKQLIEAEVPSTQTTAVWEDMMNQFNPKLQYFEIDKGRTGAVAYNGTDGCCGDDFPPGSGYGDYGYVGTVGGDKRFLCYDVNQNPNDPMFNWLDAYKDTFKIKTINRSNQKVDAISNSENWSYCDATQRHVLNDGIQLNEYGTFSNVNPNSKMACRDIATILFNKGGTVIFGDCPGETGESCCVINSIGDIDSPLEDCEDKCFNSAGKAFGAITPEKMCDDYELKCTETPTTSLGEDVTKDECPSDPDAPSCLKSDIYRPTLSADCNSQPEYDGFTTKICTATQTCGNGTIIPTSISGEKCCAGKSPFCREIPILNTPNDCIDQEGKPYPQGQYDCSGPQSSQPIGNTQQRCCFSVLIPTGEFKAAMKVHTASNSSFMCFQQNDQDVISNCCYDKFCKNANLFTSGLISNAKNRVQSAGGVFHTLDNFDILSDKGLIIDKMKRYTVSRTSSNKIIQFNPYYTMNLSQFSYIEFDIEYDTPLKVAINNYDMGDLSQYLTNGDKVYRRHHAVIPIPKVSGKSVAGDVASQLVFTPENKPAMFLIDNIILTPEGDDLKYNSKNYYCTGGFEGWIDDLDPSGFTRADFSDWDRYGPYAMTCDSQSAFGWTGSMCCGDDTKGKNYGEFYNDTKMACFNGSVVKNGWSMGYVKNYYESSDINRDQLSKFNFAGIMYYDDQFIGCQIPGNNAGLYVSKNGSNTSIPLVQNFTKDQCARVGKYFCMNGVWREKVLADGEETVFADGTMSVKKSPAGSELIQNGFRTDQQQGMTVTGAGHSAVMGQPIDNSSWDVEGAVSTARPVPTTVTSTITTATISSDYGIIKCFGLLATDDKVCSGHGLCDEPNLCLCEPGYDSTYDCSGPATTTTGGGSGGSTGGRAVKATY